MLSYRLSLIGIIAVSCVVRANHEKEKYFSAANTQWSKQLQLMQLAAAEYRPCARDNCGCFAANRRADLAPFRATGISAQSVDDARQHGVLYQLLNGTLYRQRQCSFEFRCRGVEHFLLLAAAAGGAAAAAGGVVGDVELVVNTRDWPMVPAGDGPMPVFSFSKTPHYADILYPAWSFWQGGPALARHPTGLGRWDLLRQQLTAAAAAWPWHMRSPVAFFRGSRTAAERDTLVLLSRRRPDLVNASYTRNQAWRSPADSLGAAPVAEVSLAEHCRYRYLFNYRGVAASFRLRHLFLCAGLVLHVGDEWREFFYRQLVPWYHYIPVAANPSERQLAELVEFVREHDQLVRQIADRGRQFVLDNLRMEDVTCYWRQLLIEYRQLLKYQPILRDDMVRVASAVD